MAALRVCFQVCIKDKAQAQMAPVNMPCTWQTEPPSEDALPDTGSKY